MKLKNIALLAVAAIGLGVGTSFDTRAYGRMECLLDCRAQYDDCRAEGGSASLCSQAWAACRSECFQYH